MILEIFAIRDEKAEVFGTPFFRPSAGLASRDFADLVNDKQTTVSRHPSDFKLYKLGTYDDVSGALTMSPQPVYLATASDFVSVK